MEWIDMLFEEVADLIEYLSYQKRRKLIHKYVKIGYIC